MFDSFRDIKPISAFVEMYKGHAIIESPVNQCVAYLYANGAIVGLAKSYDRADSCGSVLGIPGIHISLNNGRDGEWVQIFFKEGKHAKQFLTSPEILKLTEVPSNIFRLHLSLRQPSSAFWCHSQVSKRFAEFNITAIKNEITDGFLSYLVRPFVISFHLQEEHNCRPLSDASDSG